ncbi:hypothetical protein [Nocardioides aquiterrae]|uniref:Septum formation-related domain-containing protein n=1 Tax=Nocardioides aquiterrae TaxID=203799 RepID=A0ABN1U921_9ACTN
MRRSPLSPRSTLATTAALLLAGGLLGTAPAVAGDPTWFGAPPVGACFDLTLRQAAAPASPELPVDCSQDHTLLVTAVALLPDDLTWDSPRRAILKAVNKVCGPAQAATIGRNRLQLYRSQYRTYFFAPTAQQKSLGARWFDCLVAVPEDSRLTDLPLTPTPLSADLPDDVARCVTRKRHFTTCADTHAWRSSYAFYARGKATQSTVRRAARRGCAGHLTSRKYLFSWWDVPGRRYVVGCYSQTRR